MSRLFFENGGWLKISREYLIDLIFISLSVMVALLLSEAPEEVYKVKPSAPEKNIIKTKDNAANKGAENESLKNSGKDYKDIKERNIFAADGRYAASLSGKAALPDVPYTLIGIIHDREKRAFFTEYTGKVVSFREGEEMVDGFKVLHIERLHVNVKRGKKEAKEYKIFNLEKKK